MNYYYFPPSSIIAVVDAQKYTDNGGFSFNRCQYIIRILLFIIYLQYDSSNMLNTIFYLIM